MGHAIRRKAAGLKWDGVKPWEKDVQIGDPVPGNNGVYTDKIKRK